MRETASSRAHARLSARPELRLAVGPDFCELPYLDAMFSLLSDHPVYRRYRYVIASRQGPPLPPQTPDTVLIWLSNEDEYIPVEALSARWVFVPYARQNRPQANVRVLPLGWHGDFAPSELVPWTARDLDVFFSGQLIPPRAAFAREILGLMGEVGRNFPLRSYVGFGSRFQGGLPPAAYTDMLSRSKVVLAPQGWASITYRLFEALRAGCIPVTPPLPALWFLRDLPRLEAPADWSGLREGLLSLFANPERMAQMHQSCLQHYARFCSPEAVAVYVASVLKSEP